MICFIPVLPFALHFEILKVRDLESLSMEHTHSHHLPDGTQSATANSIEREQEDVDRISTSHSTAQITSPGVPDYISHNNDRPYPAGPYERLTDGSQSQDSEGDNRSQDQVSSSSDPRRAARLTMPQYLFSPTPRPITLWNRTGPSEFLPNILSEHQFDRDNWLREARARRDVYGSPDVVVPPVRWVLVEDGDRIPDDAIQTGTDENSEPLYSIRTAFNGSLLLGKGGHHMDKYGSLTFDSLEYQVSCFEVLVGDTSYIDWIDSPYHSPFGGFCGPTSTNFGSDSLSPSSTDSTPPPAFSSGSSGFNPNLVLRRPFYPVEGGFDRVAQQTHGEKILLLLAQAPFNAGWHPGSVVVGDDHCAIGWGGGTAWIREFRLLVWSSFTPDEADNQLIGY